MKFYNSFKMIRLIGLLAFTCISISLTASSLSNDVGAVNGDIHEQLEQLLDDCDLGFLPYHGKETVEGSMQITREGKIVLREIIDGSPGIKAELRKHLNDQKLYNIEEYRGKKVLFKITLKREN